MRLKSSGRDPMKVAVGPSEEICRRSGGVRPSESGGETHGGVTGEASNKFFGKFSTSYPHVINKIVQQV